MSNERIRVIPGELRECDVKIGRLVPISPGAVPRFLDEFEHVYSKLGKAETVIAATAAHHRLLWMHPFLDGNGRVARLMLHAMLLEALDTRGVWSIARGLAHNEPAYKSHLIECDLLRRNDLDGRGNLTEEGLVAFTIFFLENCINQVKFMEALMQPDRLRQRILLWTKEEIGIGALPVKTERILEAMLYRGELQRSDVAEILGVGERQARRVIAKLSQREIIDAKSKRTTLRLAFPATLAAR